MTGETSIRLVVGEHTMVVQHELKETVAVVIPTGHAIAKSLRRMIRRMARKVRAPYVAPAPQAPPGAVAGTHEVVSRAPSPPQAAPPTRGPGIVGQHGTAQPAAPSKPMSNGWGDRFSS